MRKHLPLIYILIVLLGLSVAYSAMMHYSTEGYVKVNVLRMQEDTIIIGYECKAIVADTSPERAHSIKMALVNRIDGRPMTHDTFVQTLDGFNITLEAVKIQRYDDQYYYSDMIFNQDKKVLILDSMPSDAIAIALRMDAPIYINETLLEEVGKDIC